MPRDGFEDAFVDAAGGLSAAGAASVDDLSSERMRPWSLIS
jgi:hypothetical protein